MDRPSSPQERRLQCHVRAREPNIGNGVMICNGLCGSKNSEYSPEGVGTQKGGARGACYNVQLRTLNSILRELRPRQIDVVKMDIEGHECSALEGGNALFKRYRPQFLKFETAWLRGHSTSDTCVHRLAKRYGYDAVANGPNTVLRHAEQ